MGGQRGGERPRVGAGTGRPHPIARSSRTHGFAGEWRIVEGWPKPKALTNAKGIHLATWVGFERRPEAFEVLQVPPSVPARRGSAGRRKRPRSS